MKFSIFNFSRHSGTPPHRRWQFSIAIVAFLLLATPTHAAELYFGTQGKEVGVGQTFEVGVFLDTQGQPINAVEAMLTVQEELLTIKEVRDGNSYVSLWLDKPSIQQHMVPFAGIIPGGYNGNEAYLFSLILEAKKSGIAVIRSENDSVLLNDGDGSAAAITRAPLTLTIKETGVLSQYTPPNDDTPPESFVPQIGQDQSVFDGKWFVAFTTQDKQSGIAHYDLWESPRSYKAEKLRKKINIPWKLVESPAVLEDQSGTQYVYIRATDKAGNTRIAAVAPIHPLPWYENIANWSILLVGTFLVFGALLWFHFHMKRNKS